MAGKLPASASVAHADAGAKLVAPSAARNTAALVELLHAYAPTSGKALEIASGTGQHVSAFATAFPQVRWQPTEIDAARRSSIDAYVAEAALDNVAPAVELNAAKAGWGEVHSGNDMILLVNLLHLIPMADAKTLIHQAAVAMRPSGRLILYGPFSRSGRLISDGDARFDAELRGADPLIGYKDDLDISALLGDAGFSSVQIVEMPANNLAFIARKVA